MDTKVGMAFIVLSVLAVALIAVLSRTDISFDSPTGMVIDCPSGPPVCVVDGKYVKTYPSACNANAAGLRIIYNNACDRISTD